jgi:metal-sulfur cluster biosynthetic enzyme
MPSKDSIVPTVKETGVTEAKVRAAIADVLDPELDEPLVKLGFIDRVEVDGPDVTVIFKLPTFWCAPNFAYLMAGDLREHIRALPEVRSVRVLLLDHFAEDEINQGINAGKPFEEAFPGEVPEGEDLEELRRIFLRKAFLMRQDTLLRSMLKAKLDESTIINLRVGDLIVDEYADSAFVATSQGMIRLDRMGKNAGAYLRKRKIIGLPQDEQAELITDDQGQPVAPGALQEFLRRSRSIRLNIAFNTTFCTGMFRTRYENAGALEAHREGEQL